MGSKRDKLIKLLAKHGNTYISGQELSEQLNISRTAIWKHMNELKKDGYEFETAPKKGYRLIKAPEAYNETTIKWGLTTSWLGKPLHFKEMIDSTQNLAHELAKKQAPHGTVIIANEQTAARGRLERPYESRDGGIWMSIVLRPPMAPYQAAQFTLFTSVIITEVLSEMTNLPIQIKWPNDLFVHDQKLSGILTEMSGELDYVNYLILGIGINVNQEANQFSKDVKEKATSLFIETEKKWDRAVLVQKLLEKFEQHYEDYVRNGFGPYKEKWTKLAYKMNETITIKSPKEKYQATLVGIDNSGALLVQRENEPITPIYSGEIIW